MTEQLLLLLREFDTAVKVAAAAAAANRPRQQMDPMTWAEEVPPSEPRVTRHSKQRGLIVVVAAAAVAAAEACDQLSFLSMLLPTLWQKPLFAKAA